MNSNLQYLPEWKQHLYSVLCLVLSLGITTVLSELYFKLVAEVNSSITVFYMLAVIIVSRYTVRYVYGLLAGVASVILINFFFTYPYNMIKFSMEGFPTILGIMTVVSILISEMSSDIISQESTIIERDKQISEIETEKMRANLLRAVSHDLRTPLTGIMGNSSLILESGENLDESEKRNLITNIYEDSHWLLNVVENILTVTRIRSDKISINTSDESVEEVIAEALQKVNKRYPDTAIVVHIPEDLLFIPMDAILIEQVTINLIINAIVHSASQRPIELIVRCTTHTVIFTVRDYGAGIPKDKLDGLFNGVIYSTAQPDAYNGMGIGLSICKTIITAHHGTIIGRNHDEGAEFIFTLPRE